jgi:hypothetical protein
MKRFYLVIAGVGIIIIAFFLFSNGKHEKDPNFITIENGSFQLNGKPFYPVAINYMAGLRTDGKEFWPSPYPEYGPLGEKILFDKDSSLKLLKADLEMIKQMGFNSIRFANIGEVKRETGVNEWFYINTLDKSDDSARIIFKDGITYIKYLKAIDELVELSKNAGLKIIFLVKLQEQARGPLRFMENVMQHYRNEPTIMAYDLFNEPLYFHKLERSKPEIYKITKRWEKFIRKNAPNQLTTVGLTGIREVFEWDPNIVNVDFISFHPYEYEPNQVMNEIYWYGKYMEKPWIIGETSFPANDDSVKYAAQDTFAKQTLDQVCNCGGIGYSWWQYKDVQWGTFHSDYMGIVNWNGTTTNEKGNTIFGTPKPLQQIFQSYVPVKNKNNCLKFDNYYNLSGYKDHRILGTILDENGKPIEGAVIMGWSEDWNQAVSTVSKKDGTFELFSNFAFGHWIASATHYNTLRENFWNETQMELDRSTMITNYDLGRMVFKKVF